MKVLMISKAFVASAYHAKLRELSRLGVETLRFDGLELLERWNKYHMKVFGIIKQPKGEAHPS